MKKMINTSFVYAIAAMAGGVFYREFTKFNGFTARTSLGLVHTHLFLLGMLFFLVAALFAKALPLLTHKRFRLFYGLYNAGVCVTAAMLLVRGVLQVLAVPVSRALDASVSGIAGVGHIMTGVGLIVFFTMLRSLAPSPSKS